MNEISLSLAKEIRSLTRQDFVRYPLWIGEMPLLETAYPAAEACVRDDRPYIAEVEYHLLGGGVAGGFCFAYDFTGFWIFSESGKAVYLGDYRDILIDNVDGEALCALALPLKHAGADVHIRFCVKASVFDQERPTGVIVLKGRKI